MSEQTERNDSQDRSERDRQQPIPENPKKVSRDEVDPTRSNLVKDPEDWVSGDERMTAAQASYFKTLCEEANEEFDPNLTKAEASRRIDELREKTGRA